MKPTNFSDEYYTHVFHSPGIEPWVCGLLNKRTVNRVLDIGCGLGSWGFIIKSYISQNAEIIGVDKSGEKPEKLRDLRIYSKLISSDIVDLKSESNFDVMLAIEVLHELSNVEKSLPIIEMKLARKGLIIICGPSTRSLARTLEERNYTMYECSLRGLILTEIQTGKAKLMWSESKAIRILGSLISIRRHIYGTH